MQHFYPDDYLWPDLSAKEHLELFAGLRGVKADERADIVQKWLESVDLAEVQLQYSNAYSGGMKRRLSVALATIGDRPLIILDEPTTGMDPVRSVEIFYTLLFLQIDYRLCPSIGN